VTIQAMLRRIADSGYGRCKACGGSPLVSDEQADGDMAWRLRAFCHGSTERLEVSMESFRYDQDKVADLVVAFVRDLFKLDRLPDVMELLHYNRGTLPKVVS